MTTTTETNARVQAWCAEARTLHGAYTAPLKSDDPRLEILNEHHVDHFGAESGNSLFRKLASGDHEHVVEEFFRLCIDLPASPYETPSWAASSDVRVEVWPECMVTFRSPIVTNGETTIWWEHQRTIIADDSEWPECPECDDPPATEPAGKVIDHGFNLIVKHAGRYLDLEGVDAQDAKALGEAIIKASTLIPEPPAAIHRSTEPGEPDFGGIGGGL